MKNILIIPVGDTLEYCCEVMKYLENKGYGASIYFEDVSLKKKISYADKIGVENIILIGEDEKNKNEIRIKNMQSGNTTNIKYKFWENK